jgi:hypothetical protein
MTTAVASDLLVSSKERTETQVAPALAVAAFASMGAGAIHAAAIGVHSEAKQAQIAFAVAAFLQIAWAALALWRPQRLIIWAGAAINVVALGGFLLAKINENGIPFIDGLDSKEAVQFADGTAAALALLAVVGAVLAATVLRSSVPWYGSIAFALTAVATAVVTLFGMVAAGNHTHSHGAETMAADGHSHGGSTDPGGTGGSSPDGHNHGVPVVVPPKAYDPTKPIDLSGVEGVTPEQQARAENLIAITLDRLPKYADYKVAEADGFRSIGDGVTGDEHFVKLSYFEDDHILNPDYPESLVYSTKGGKRTLEAAMFMLNPGTTLDDVPDIGGKLTQWHVHDNLCFTVTGRVGGLRAPNGKCNPPLVEGGNVPMIHVWITPNECGPFSALEGIGGGTVAAGETKLCDHVHGAGS